VPANRMKDGVSFLSYRLFLLDRCHPTTKTANLLIPSFANHSHSFQSKLFRRSEHAVLAYGGSATVCPTKWNKYWSFT